MGQVDFGFELRLVPLYAGRLAMVEHPMAPGVLAAPVHTHTREDECSYVLAGRIEALIGDGEVQAGPGDIVWKPRDVPHTFWNPGPERALVVEVITPGGLEGYFEELEAMLEAGPVAPQRVGELAGRYGLTPDMDSIPALLARGLRLPGLPGRTEN
jgi:mannose-6-phosphate isomerase-like protein (cupin superfamily)